MAVVLEVTDFDPFTYRLQKRFGYKAVNKALGTDWRYFSTPEEAVEIVKDLISESESDRVKYASSSKTFRLLSGMF